VNLPHLYLAPPLGVMSLEFHQDFGIGKLESLGYPTPFLMLS